MKYKDQGKKMKMAGGGVAEDMKPMEKDLQQQCFMTSLGRKTEGSCLVFCPEW